MNRVGSRGVEKFQSAPTPSPPLSRNPAWIRGIRKIAWVLIVGLTATLPSCCIVYSARTVAELVKGEGRDSLYAGTREEWSVLKRLFDSCLPIGIAWSIDLPFTAFTDTMLAPFAWIPVDHKTSRERKPEVMPDNQEVTGGR